jgi:T4 bacteriophage base plate protein
MKLPKIDHPTYDVIVPSTKKKVKVRPMLVKEEKILLMAKEGSNPYEIFQAIKQVVNNCIITGDFDSNKLTLFDLEYLFLRIRSVSIGNIVKVSYRDEDGKDYPFDIDLEKIEVKFPEGIETTIKTGDTSGFKMKYPLATIYSTETFTSGTSSEADLIEELIINSIDDYFEGENVWRLAQQPRAEIKEFLDGLDILTFNKIRDFVANLPSLYYEVKYTNSNGKEQLIKLTTLTDFFML